MPATLFNGSDRRPARIVIAGGGVAALETLLALSETARGYVEIELLAPQPELTYRPLSVAEPFGLSEPFAVDLAAIARERGARFRRGALAGVEACAHVAVLASGERLSFDVLVIATGTKAVEALPGALTFPGRGAGSALRELLRQLTAGELGSLALVLPRGVHWSLPLYELALMTAAFAAGHDVQPALHVVTPESRALEIFGPGVSAHVADLLAQAGVELHTGSVALAVQPRRLLVAPSGSIAAERVVALPRLRVPAIGGVPQRSGGFIPVDEFGRVNGFHDVYAVGDATWHPVKQGGLATQQADAAASAIAAATGAPVTAHPFEPVLRGILLTGGPPEYLKGHDGERGGASEDALWWPPAKVAGRYLAPYLAAGDVAEQLRDVHADHHPALELALEAADAAAGWGDFDSALRWLGVAERLNIVLPRGYPDKRREWRTAVAA